ncbi:hypothetical protein FACS1894164_04380 [Spirochaetia bacterium]|nr:hypothetical protein FACS1894164_04380 [Spirochaetia bacterium]
MERLTQLPEKGNEYFVEESTVRKTNKGYSGPAIQRLGIYENALQKLMVRLENIESEVQRYKEDGREKSVLFRELLGKKFLVKEMIDLLLEGNGGNGT